MNVRLIMHTLSILFLLSLFGVAAYGLVGKDRSEYAVKTIKTEYGDIYDCVDFYKQPAFDHPLLKNHSFHPEMRPSFTPKRISNSNRSWKTNAKPAHAIPLKDGGCPRGTVPIRRLNKSIDFPEPSVLINQLIGAKNVTPSNNEISGTIFAIGQTTSAPPKTYDGVGSMISVYNPRALPTQYSSGEVIIRGGKDVIIAGWTVNPSKYPDTDTRTFIYAIPNGKRCFNAECGFVIVNRKYSVDSPLSPLSTRGGDIYVQNFTIYRDSGKWWFRYGMFDPPITVGFWPEEIFSGLKGPGTYAACGGEAYTVATVPPPEMGAGFYPEFAPQPRIDAYCQDMYVMNNQAQEDPGDTVAYKTHHDYGAVDMRMKDGQHLITFGGP